MKRLLALALLGSVSGCTCHSTGANEVGVLTRKVAPFGTKGVQQDVYGSGATYFFPAVITDWNTFETKLQNLKMTKLKQLLMKRQQLVSSAAKLKTQISHVNKNMHKDLRAPFTRFDKSQLKKVQSLIEKIDHLVQMEIEAHPEVHERYELICSIPGIGRVLATNLLALTDDFTRFDSPRALACHCGVAPFEHSSGSSVRGKTRTSPKANTWLKTLLHMSAVVAVRNDAGLATYYKRKVDEGKPKLLVLNAVRAKLIHRVFAVLRKGEPYNTNLLQMS